MTPAARVRRHAKLGRTLQLKPKDVRALADHLRELEQLVAGLDESMRVLYAKLADAGKGLNTERR